MLIIETALKAISKVLDTVKDFPVGTRDQEDDHHLGQAQKPVPQVEEITPSSENPVQVIEKEQGEWGKGMEQGGVGYGNGTGGMG